MMRCAAAAAIVLWAALGAACKQSAPAPQAALQDDAGPGCEDAWLAAHHLNEYGDPPGTLYAGGTPLFDEKTGKRTDRHQLLYKNQPSLRAACPR